MSVKLKHCRSRSTSDILDDKRSQNNSMSFENKYRIYGSMDLKENSCEQKKEQSTRKSQNFVKKLIASLERKNEVYKANDEFYATYYKRNDNSNLNSDYSFDGDPKTSEELDKIGRSLTSNLTMDKLSLEDFKQEQNSKLDFIQNAEPNCDNITANVLLQKDVKNMTFCKYEKNASEMNEQQKFVDTELVKVQHENSLLDLNGNKERKRFLDFCSSYNSKIFQVDLQNRSNTPDSCTVKRKKENKRSTLERILFMNSNKEEKRAKKKSHSDVYTKKLNSSKTFKDFIISMVKWKKSGNEEKSQCFMSNGERMFDLKSNIILPRVSYFQDAVFQEDKKRDLK